MTLPSYLLAAMLAWTSGSNRADRNEARYLEIATDIASVATSEPALFRDDASRTKSALVLLSIAFWESGFSAKVDRGELLGDRGLAVSLWQIHDEGGLVMLPSGYAHARDVPGATDIVTAARLKADRRLAARMALHIALGSLKRSGGLCGYSGEPGPCPRAKLRLEHAIQWYRSHPWAE